MSKKILIAIVVATLGVLIALQYPALFIKKQLECRSFVLYANHEMKPTDATKSILDSALLNLKASKFYRSDFHGICQRTRFNKNNHYK